MKQILKVIEDYVKNFPSPNNIEIYTKILKLTYIYTNPYSNQKNKCQKYLPIFPQNQFEQINQSSYNTLIYNETNKILSQNNSFYSILIKQKHQKILQDDIFGKGNQNICKNKWVYIAEIKQQKEKSYFLNGKGKSIYQNDFGENFDHISKSAIFIWNKLTNQVTKIVTDNQLIPACAFFSNLNGSKIIFHAYKRNGYGLLHCFNRPVAIYEAILTQQQTEHDKDSQATFNIKKLFEDGNQTNIFPSISPCYQYMVYLSGTGITHSFYLDIVVMKKISNENDQKWVELHRIKNKVIGLYNTVKTYSFMNQGRATAYIQTLDDGQQKVLCLDLQSGVLEDLIKNQVGMNLNISNITPQGLLLGKISTHNYQSFFYYFKKKFHVVKPVKQEKFVLLEIRTPIHAYLLKAQIENIRPEFKYNCEKRPLIVVIHGGPHTSADPCLTLMKYSLLQMGYYILMPNFMGSTGYGQKVVNSCLGNIGETDAKQIIQLLQNTLKSNKDIDKDKVYVCGGSYGGYMSAIMGTRYSQYFKSCIIMNGVLSMMANFWFSDIPEWNVVETLGNDKFHQMTEKDYQQMFRQSPISLPMKLPTLQFLGAKDRRVPFRQGLLFDTITKQNGTQITTYVYENSGHSLVDSVDTSIDIVIKTLMFLEGQSINQLQ